LHSGEAMDNPARSELVPPIIELAAAQARAVCVLRRRGIEATLPLANRIPLNLREKTK
jgi:hypothetical protein